MTKEITKRLISSILLIPITLFFIVKGNFFFSFFIIICLLITMYEWYMMSKNKAYHFFGHIFLLISFCSAYLIREDLILFLLITLICILTDIGGFVLGKTFKGPKLTKISPKKTYAGVIGGYFFSLIFTNILVNNSEIFTQKYNSFGVDEFIFVLIISSVSQIGDIIISYFKRLSKIKDSGKLIPGHGGILDRIDGMIFAFPFYYIYNLIINI
tara:strand:+ start:922 stop:1560 length:639 start_codon:yes stop_codon:yes gene_type:complete